MQPYVIVISITSHRLSRLLSLRCLKKERERKNRDERGRRMREGAAFITKLIRDSIVLYLHLIPALFAYKNISKTKRERDREIKEKAHT